MWRIWRATRTYRKFVRDPYSFMRSRMGGDAAQASRQGAPRKRKKISRDTGEYIAFTEIEGTTVTDASTSYTEIQAESQVIDVEWEDL